ncbi:MAG: glutathione S-transferase C-terminal domain-containing protein [Pseudomonadota bacterium]
MLDGTYHVDDPAPKSAADGAFRRAASPIRDQIDGPIDPARYHLYLAVNCPWAHRVWLMLTLKGVDMTKSFALPKRTDQGWVFDAEGRFFDPLNGFTALHELYATTGTYTGRITVPVLVDKETGALVNNESADILRILNRGLGGTDFLPTDRMDNIEAWNARIYPNLNNGVYRAGFARTQEAYDAAVMDVFDTLDAIEHQLSQTRYLTGDQLTEADIRLFPTLVRFDVGYHSAFKCNRARIIDYPNLWAYAREMYQMDGVPETVDFDIYRYGYHSKSELRNPLGIIPIGPSPDWAAPHGRG